MKTPAKSLLRWSPSTEEESKRFVSPVTLPMKRASLDMSLDNSEPPHSHRRPRLLSSPPHMHVSFSAQIQMSPGIHLQSSEIEASTKASLELLPGPLLAWVLLFLNHGDTLNLARTSHSIRNSVKMHWSTEILEFKLKERHEARRLQTQYVDREFPAFMHNFLLNTPVSIFLRRSACGLRTLLHTRSPKELKVRHPFFARQLDLTLFSKAEMQKRRCAWHDAHDTSLGLEPLGSQQIGQIEQSCYPKVSNLISRGYRKLPDDVPEPHDLSPFDLLMLILGSSQTLEKIAVRTFDTNPMRLSTEMHIKCPRRLALLTCLKSCVSEVYRRHQVPQMQDGENEDEIVWWKTLAKKCIKELEDSWDDPSDRGADPEEGFHKQEDVRNGDLCACWDAVWRVFTMILTALSSRPPTTCQVVRNQLEMFFSLPQAELATTRSTATCSEEDVRPVNPYISEFTGKAPRETHELRPVKFPKLKYLEFGGWSLSAFLVMARTFRFYDFPELEVIKFKGAFLVSPALDESLRVEQNVPMTTRLRRNWNVNQQEHRRRQFNEGHQNNMTAFPPLLSPRSQALPEEGGALHRLGAANGRVPAGHPPYSWKADAATSLALLMNPFCRNYGAQQAHRFWHQLFDGQSVWTSRTFPKLRHLAICPGNFESAREWIATWVRNCFMEAPLLEILEFDHSILRPLLITDAILGIFDYPNGLRRFVEADEPQGNEPFPKLSVLRILRVDSLAELLRLQELVSSLLGRPLIMQIRKLHMKILSKRFATEWSILKYWKTFQRNRAPSSINEEDRERWSSLWSYSERSHVVLHFDPHDPEISMVEAQGLLNTPTNDHDVAMRLMAHVSGAPPEYPPAPPLGGLLGARMVDHTEAPPQVENPPPEPVTTGGPLSTPNHIPPAPESGGSSTEHLPLARSPDSSASSGEIVARENQLDARDAALYRDRPHLSSPDVYEFKDVAKLSLRLFDPTCAVHRHQLMKCRFPPCQKCSSKIQTSLRRVNIHLDIPGIWLVSSENAVKNLTKQYLVEVRKVIRSHPDLSKAAEFKIHPVSRLTYGGDHWKWWEDEVTHG